MGLKAEGDTQLAAWLPLRCPKCSGPCGLFGVYIQQESAEQMAKRGEPEHAISPTPLCLRCAACGTALLLPDVAWDGSFQFGDTICDFNTPGSRN